jgi:UDP-N-acetylmuramoyl-L-alanyl-D-glutamate--2,6-diaminopimelate ligase
MDKIENITGITCDSRKVKPGYIFVAIKGLKDDGNNYVKEAIGNGASLIITDQSISRTKLPVMHVDDARKSLGKLAAKLYNKPDKKINVIGVTGTNGKTTTTHLIYNLLNSTKKQSGLIGTINVDTGEKISKGNLTTPPPVLLQKYLSKMTENKLDYCCMEVSSHGIHLKRTSGTNFSVKVGTNITRDHFDLHADFSEYIEVKKSFLKEKSQDCLVLLNQDDPQISNFNQIAEKQVNYSIKQPTTVKANNIIYDNKKTNFVYSLNKELPSPSRILKPQKFKITMQLPGSHNIYNVLVAITIGLYYGLQPETIKNFFTNYQGVWRRLQIIYNERFTIIDDCAHNPGSYGAVFSAIKKLSYNKLFIINSIRGNRGCKINKANADTIATNIKKLNNYELIISNCDDTAKKIDKVKDEEKNIFLTRLQKINIPYTHFNKLIPSLEKTLNKVGQNDLILLLGPHSMDEAGKITLQILEQSNVYV